jgi:glycosyltransferase involved in cell wall biosynthesis
VRILYLSDIRFPLERANGIQTFETCRALAARGHDVTLLVRPDTVTPPRDPWTFYGAPRTSGLTVLRSPTVPAFARRAAYVVSAVGRLMRSPAPDVVFTRDLGIASIVLLLPGRRPALVYEAHGFAPLVSEELPRLIATATTPSALKLARLARRERRVWRGAHGYVTLTATHLAELEHRFGSRANAAVVPDGTRLAPAREYVPPPAPPVVGYAGHLYAWKGVDVLIDALARVPGVRGLVIGGQPGERDRARLEALAHARGVADRVELAGWRHPAEIAGLLRGCSVLVLPNVRSTISERYTSPLKLFEYMAAGRAIVASDLPALREVLTDGVNALLVEPGRPEPLAAAIRRLLSNPTLMDRLARAAFADASRFGWDSRAERLERVLTAAEVAA